MSRHYTSVLLAMTLVAGARPSACQSQMTETQFIASVNTAIDSLTQPLAALARSRIIYGGQLVYAHGSAIANAPLNTLLAYVDGLKAAGAQRIEFNPGIASMSNPAAVAKYDALVRHIRELGLQLAINPEVNPGEAGSRPTFQAFQNLALPAWQQMAARYQPENFVIVHEACTMDDRLALNTNVQAWHNFILAAAALIKAASPHTRLGAGGFQNGALPFMTAQEDLYWRDFVTIPVLDFMTIDIYNIDTFDRYAASPYHDTRSPPASTRL